MEYRLSARFVFGRFSLFLVGRSLFGQGLFLLSNPLDCRCDISALEFGVLASLLDNRFQMFHDKRERNLR